MQDGTFDMTFALVLPRFTPADGCQECRFKYGYDEWALRNYSERLGEDKLVRFSLYLDQKELDPFMLLGKKQWQRWSQLPYDFPDPQLIQGDLPSALLSNYVKAILDAYTTHVDKASCFWPTAS